MFTTDNGVFRDDDPTDTGTGDIEDQCDSTTDLGTTAFATTAGATDTTAGRAYVLLCGTSGSAGKVANVTAKVVGQESVTLTKAITISGKPASSDIKATISGNTVNVEAMVNGQPIPDESNVRFQVVPADNGAVASACVASNKGKASTAVAVNPGTNVTVLVTVGEAPDGSDAACAVADARTYGSTSVIVSGSGTTTPPPSGGTGGSGTFAAAPVFSASKLANVVFMGGTVAQLDAALVANNATGAWAQNAQGKFILYVVNGGFVNDEFKAAFPNGLPNPSALTVVGK
jgi:hypothetical protein